MKLASNPSQLPPEADSILPESNIASLLVPYLENLFCTESLDHVINAIM